MHGSPLPLRGDGGDQPRTDLLVDPPDRLEEPSCRLGRSVTERSGRAGMAGDEALGGPPTVGPERHVHEHDRVRPLESALDQRPGAEPVDDPARPGLSLLQDAGDALLGHPLPVGAPLHVVDLEERQAARGRHRTGDRRLPAAAVADDGHAAAQLESFRRCRPGPSVHGVHHGACAAGAGGPRPCRPEVERASEGYDRSDLPAAAVGSRARRDAGTQGRTMTSTDRARSFADPVVLGRTGLRVSRLGLGSSFGIGGSDLEHALDRGINYFYWGTLRREGFARGLRPLLHARRDDVVLVVQSYARLGSLVRISVEHALRRLGTDRCELLLLGLWNRPVRPGVMAAARRLVERGLARHVLVSCHDRSQLERHWERRQVGAVMVRYNAVHPGAERDVFPLLPADPQARPGVVAYTATCWGWLVDPRRTPAAEPRPRASDCYRFALTQQAVDVCLAGPRDRADLDEALAALDRGPMDPDELAWMKRVGSRVDRRSRVPWQG